MVKAKMKIIWIFYIGVMLLFFLLNFIPPIAFSPDCWNRFATIPLPGGYTMFPDNHIEHIIKSDFRLSKVSEIGYCGDYIFGFARELDSYSEKYFLLDVISNDLKFDDSLDNLRNDFSVPDNIEFILHEPSDLKFELEQKYQDASFSYEKSLVNDFNIRRADIFRVYIYARSWKSENKIVPYNIDKVGMVKCVAFGHIAKPLEIGCSTDYERFFVLDMNKYDLFDGLTQDEMSSKLDEYGISKQSLSDIDEFLPEPEDIRGMN